LESINQILLSCNLTHESKQEPRNQTEQNCCLKHAQNYVVIFDDLGTAVLIHPSIHQRSGLAAHAAMFWAKDEARRWAPCALRLVLYIKISLSTWQRICSPTGPISILDSSALHSFCKLPAMKSFAWFLLATPLFLMNATGSQLKRVTEVPTSRTAYTTDLFKGIDEAIQESALNNSDLTYTRRNGKPYFQPLGAQRAGKDGPLLLQDVHLLDTLATFNRERIPERVVHARGSGAHGFFEATSDFAASLSAAKFFQKGTRTSVTVRFSTVGGARGSADQARDPRGVAIKFRTSEGILSWVFNNTPVFFLRDPAKVFCLVLDDHVTR
jgi:hypothetical protein